MAVECVYVWNDQFRLLTKDSGATCHMCNNAKMFAKFKCNSRGWACGGEGIVQVKRFGGVICGKFCSYQSSSINVVVKYSPMMGKLLR